MTWTPDDLYAAYVVQEDIYRAAALEIESRIKLALASATVPVHQVSARAKDAIELFKKQRRKNYTDPWKDCPDLVGARVIVADSTQKSLVIDSLTAIADVTILEIEDQSVDADPAQIAYRGLHVHLSFSDISNVRGEAIRCEVQIRTIAEHAWSETVHHYVYKTPISISPEIQRTFNRLLVLVELFDQELARGASEVVALEEFALLQLSRHLESALQDFVRTPSDTMLSIESIGDLVRAGFGSTEHLRELADDYVTGHRDDIAALMTTFGPGAEGFDVANDWMLSQGESLLYLALLDHDDFALGNALDGSDLYRFVEALALRTGHDGFARQ